MGSFRFGNTKNADKMSTRREVCPTPAANALLSLTLYLSMQSNVTNTIITHDTHSHLRLFPYPPLRRNPHLNDSLLTDCLFLLFSYPPVTDDEVEEPKLTVLTKQHKDAIRAIRKVRISILFVC